MSSTKLVRSSLKRAARLFIGPETCALLGVEPFASCTRGSPRDRVVEGAASEREVPWSPAPAPRSRWVRF